jgi:phenylpyruvate tautomerase PptA (4-oxalocrotonate tautomerase family)
MAAVHADIAQSAARGNDRLKRAVATTDNARQGCRHRYCGQAGFNNMMYVISIDRSARWREARLRCRIRKMSMPYLHLDLPAKYEALQKRELADRLCRLYSSVMKTQHWRPNVGIAELGEDNLFHLGPDGLEPIVMVLVEFRAGRPNDFRLELAKGIVDACVEILGVPRRWVLVEFTPHVGEEIYRDGKWVADWTPEESALP